MAPEDRREMRALASDLELRAELLRKAGRSRETEPVLSALSTSDSAATQRMTGSPEDLPPAGGV